MSAWQCTICNQYDERCDCITIANRREPPKGWKKDVAMHANPNAIINEEGLILSIELVDPKIEAVIGRQPPVRIKVEFDSYDTQSGTISFDVIEYLLAERERITEGK